MSSVGTQRISNIYIYNKCIHFKFVTITQREFIEPVICNLGFTKRIVPGMFSFLHTEPKSNAVKKPDWWMITYLHQPDNHIVGEEQSKSHLISSYVADLTQTIAKIQVQQQFYTICIERMWRFQWWWKTAYLWSWRYTVTSSPKTIFLFRAAIYPHRGYDTLWLCSNVQLWSSFWLRERKLHRNRIHVELSSSN